MADLFPMPTVSVIGEWLEVMRGDIEDNIEQILTLYLKQFPNTPTQDLLTKTFAYLDFITDTLTKHQRLLTMAESRIEELQTLLAAPDIPEPKRVELEKTLYSLKQQKQGGKKQQAVTRWLTKHGVEVSEIENWALYISAESGLTVNDIYNKPWDAFIKLNNTIAVRTMISEAIQHDARHQQQQ